MNSKVIVLILSFFCYQIANGSVRVTFTRCSAGGFTCTNVGKNVALQYQCPTGTNDITFYLNTFSSPGNIESLVIRNCSKVNLLVRCTGEKRNILTVDILNIKHLVLERTNFVSSVPPNFNLKNIDYIESIPSFTFSQYIKPIHTSGCSVPSRDFGNFSMTNVNIDTVESNAFYMPSGFGVFEMTNVTIKRLQSSAILIRYENNGRFIMKNSNFGILEHLAVQLFVKNVTIHNNKFIEIASSGINGSIENFSFTDNTVNTLQPHGFSILSQNVFIQNNKIEYLKSGALEKISPGLLEDSGRNFGSLQFTYLFKENYVHFLDAGSLNPDVDAYNNVRSEVDIVWNQFTCNCEDIGWLISELGHGSNTALMADLYESILDEDSKNFCAHACQSPLSTIRRMVINGKCNLTVTALSLCDDKQTTIMNRTVTKKPAIFTKTTVRYLHSSKNRTAMAMSCSDRNRNDFIILLLIIFLRKLLGLL